MRNERLGIFLCLLAWLSANAGAEPLSMLAHVRVREFRFEGNTAFSSAELTKVLAPYTGRELSAEELEDARRAVTLHYVNHGYINSGAVLPEQSVTDGVIVMRVIEGRLTETRITGNTWLRADYLRSRIQRGARPPLNLNELKDGLQLVRQNPNVAQLNAELKPGAAPGESLLDVRVVDRHPFRLGMQVDNDRPPSVGAEEILLLVGDRNLTGHGDALDISYGIAEGGSPGFRFSEFDNVAASYTVPVTASDTTLHQFVSKNNFAVIEEPFNALDIMSESYRVGVTLRQPLYRTANRELALSLTFERRHSETFLLGQPFDVTPGSVNGVTDISALRFAQEWTDRSQDQVLALRSTFSVGVDALGVTDDGTERDAKFWSWLGQAQYVRRLFGTPNQVILRADAQLTDQPLLSLEQFPIGGANTVRGYRENQLVRDRGVMVSLEFRVPVVINRAGVAVVQLAPFVDFGGGWNNQSPTPEPRTVTSAGVGLLLNPNRHISAQLYWGHPFTNIETPGNDAQDLGLHFRVSFEAF